MNIVICDDNINVLKGISNFCQSICDDEDVILTYNNPKMLCKCLLEEHPQIDFFVLDIEMPEVDGLQLKQQISNLYMNAYIVFLTSHREMMEDAFGKNVLGFLTKDNYKERLKQHIIEIKNELNIDDIIEIEIACEKKRFHKSRIIMVQSDHVYSQITIGQFYNKESKKLETRKELYRMSLGKWEEVLQDSNFYRISRSLIINFRYVQRITKEIVLSTGETVQIPVKKLKKLKDAYNDYCMGVAKVIY